MFTRLPARDLEFWRDWAAAAAAFSIYRRFLHEKPAFSNPEEGYFLLILLACLAYPLLWRLTRDGTSAATPTNQKEKYLLDAGALSLLIASIWVGS